MILKQERVVSQGIGLPVAYVDVEHLPEPMPQEHFKPVPPGDKATFIDFDLETTDLVRWRAYPHITPIAASVVRTAKEFSAYVDQNCVSHPTHGRS